MQSLFVACYNFGRKHEALKGTTPATASQLNGPRMDDQRTDREGRGISQRLPRFRIRALFILFTLVALWLLSARGNNGAGDDIRKASLLLLVVASGALAIYRTGHGRAFWAGFSFSLLIIAGELPGFVLNFRWLETLVGRSSQFPPVANSTASLALYLILRLACVLALCTIAGGITAHICDQSRREK